MKASLILSTLALCSFTAAKDAKFTEDVKSIIHEFYPSETPSVAASVSTALASALWSVQSTWDNSPAQTSVQAAIFSAAPTSVQKSITESGYAYREIVTQAWFTKSVPKALQTAVQKEISAIESAASSVIGTGTSKAAAPTRGVEAVVIGAAVGLVGAAMAVL
ncbi:hypothetical protein PVAG01_07704 [Phlyctema vagabunda]|uniref:Uncharacterized protein n=1 Tax=Phlyctema vagabunda TaxID=108571 RepID=A0ABR4PDA7_9HELO